MLRFAVAVMILVAPANAQDSGEAAAREYRELVRIPVNGCNDEAPLEALAQFSNNHLYTDAFEVSTAVQQVLNGARVRFADRYFDQGCYAVAEQLYYDAIRGGAEGGDLSVAQAGLARAIARR